MPKHLQKPLHTALPQGQKALALLCLLSLPLILQNAAAAADAMREGLALCARTVIPSLFPFMVLSELVVKSGASDLLGRLAAPLLRRLFGIRHEAASAVVLGLLSGFPVGARTAAALYEEGQIDSRELAHLLCFCNLPSSAFVTGAIGLSLFGSRDFGRWLYLTTLLSALLVGVGLRFFKKKERLRGTACETATPVKKRRNAPAVLTDAVCDSARAMLSVCGFVLFFGTLVACLARAWSSLSLPKALESALFGFFEMTGGVACASAVQGRRGMLLCAAIVGWSGLSVHFQIMSLCERCRVSFRPYFLAKAVQGVLNPLLLQGVFLWLAPTLGQEERVSTAYRLTSSAAIWLGLSLFGAALCVLGARAWRAWRKKSQTDKKIRQKA